jgi:hypothetical protein
MEASDPEGFGAFVISVRKDAGNGARSPQVTPICTKVIEQITFLHVIVLKITEIHVF